jgi:hypothetical protein
MAVDIKHFRKLEDGETDENFAYDSIEARGKVKERVHLAEAVLEEARDGLLRENPPEAFVRRTIEDTHGKLARIIEGLAKYPAGKEAIGKWKGSFKALIIGVGRPVELNNNPVLAKKSFGTDPVAGKSNESLTHDKTTRLRQQIVELIELVKQIGPTEEDQRLELMMEDSVYTLNELVELADMNDLGTAEAIGEMTGLIEELQRIREARNKQARKRMAA